jgi:hypothetical protein
MIAEIAKTRDMIRMILSYKRVSTEFFVKFMEHSYPKMSKVSIVAFQTVHASCFSYTFCDGDKNGDYGILEDGVPGLLNHVKLAVFLDLKGLHD